MSMLQIRIKNKIKSVYDRAITVEQTQQSQLRWLLPRKFQLIHQQLVAQHLYTFYQALIRLKKSFKKDNFFQQKVSGDIICRKSTLITACSIHATIYTSPVLSITCLIDAIFATIHITILSIRLNTFWNDTLIVLLTSTFFC